MHLQTDLLIRTLVLAALAGAGWWAMRRRGRGGSISARGLGFLAVLFLLKAAPLLGPRRGLLRADFLFPLWALWRPADGVWWIIVAAILLGGLAAVVGSGWAWRLPAALFLGVAAAFAVSFWVSLSLSNGGYPEGLIRPFQRDADYYADVARFASLAGIWSGYTEQQAGLSLHGQTHPPGAVTVLYLLDRATGGDLPMVSLGAVILGAMTLLPLWRWARLHLDGERARIGILLWMVTPAVALYGATCMDMVFAVPLVTAAWLYNRGLALASAAAGGATPGAASRAGLLWGAMAGLALGVGLLFTFAGGLLALVFAVQAGMRARATPHVRPLRLLVAAGAGSLLVLAAARLAGFDWLACLAIAVGLDAAEAPAFLSVRYYALTRLMGILDFLVLAGVALAPAWMHVVRRGLPGHRRGGAGAAGGLPADGARLTDTDALLVDGARAVAAADALLVDGARAVAAAGCLFLLAGAFKIGETGRIGLFLLPFLLLPVCRGLETFGRPRRAALALAVWGAAQALLMELFLDTRW